MLGIYLIVAVVTGLIAAVIFHYFIKNKKLAHGLTFIFIVIAIALTYLYATPYYTAWRFENTIKDQNAFLTLIATHSPDEYNTYLAKTKNNILVKGDPNNEVQYAAELINALLVKYGPVASNESLYHYLKANIEFDKKLLAIDPILVLFQEFPNKFADKIDLKKYSSNQLKNEMLGAVEQVVESGINNPHARPNAADIAKAEGLFRGIMTDLVKKYGEENVKAALTHAEDSSVDKKKAAEIIIALSEEIYSKGKETVGLLLRSTFLINKNAMNQKK